MAKDPAMLWYWNDWHSGTALFSRFLKGCYMDLLHAQFNHGRLSLEEIKICLGADFGSSWPTLQKKFKQDERGLFFNERLETEKLKRQEYSKSRREIRMNFLEKKKKSTHVNTYVEHTLQRMENENEDVNKNEKEKGGAGGKNNVPEIEEFLNYCHEKLGERYYPLEFSIRAKYDQWKDQGWKDGYGKSIKNWKTKIMNTVPHLKSDNNATGKKFTGTTEYKPLTGDQHVELDRIANPDKYQ